MILPTKKQAQKWANALRSGKYKQTVGVLEDYAGYCCLGVACKILISESKLKYDVGFLRGGMPTSQPAAPKWLKEIDSTTKELIGEHLTNMNDARHNSFDEIADVIELLYVHGAIKPGDPVSDVIEN